MLSQIDHYKPGVYILCISIIPPLSLRFIFEFITQNCAILKPFPPFFNVNSEFLCRPFHFFPSGTCYKQLIATVLRIRFILETKMLTLASDLRMVGHKKLYRNRNVLLIIQHQYRTSLTEFSLNCLGRCRFETAFSAILDQHVAENHKDVFRGKLFKRHVNISGDGESDNYCMSKNS